MRTRLFVLLLITLIPLLVFYEVFRTRTLQQQHFKGHSATGNARGGDSQAETVLSVGKLYVTYDSTSQDSALWIARPAETLRSWFLPPAEAPFEFDPIIRWHDAGRVAWYNTGAASADLLIEFAPEGNHRLDIVRVTCAAGRCGSSVQERGLTVGPKLWVGDDGTAILLSDSSLVLYSSIADLMNDANEIKQARLTTPDKGELAAASRSATVVLSNPKDLSGEIIEGRNHSRVRLRITPAGTGVALMMNNNLRLVVDTATATQFWDCPASLLGGSAECTVYSAPAGFSRALPVALSDAECGIVISRGGWTWLVRRIARTQDIFQADGLATCRDGEIVAYQGRHVVYVVPKRDTVNSTQQTAQLERVD